MKDHGQFLAANRCCFESHSACHNAADKPFLRPQAPIKPAEPTFDFDPEGTWTRRLRDPQPPPIRGVLAVAHEKCIGE